MTILSLTVEPAARAFGLRPQRVPLRLLPLETAPNVRDVGGYVTLDSLRTRWGMLLRGSRLSGLSPRDYSAILNYEIRSVIDLRTADEAFEAPNAFAGSPSVRYHRVPLRLGSDFARLGTQPANLAELNRLWLEHGACDIKEVFDLLCVPGAFPAIVHCTLGKDRTGLIVALLLGALHVPTASIVDDYTLSGPQVQPLLDHALERGVRRGVDPLWLERMFLCHRATMERTLDEIDNRYGSVSAYLIAIGVDEGQLTYLRTELLERTESIPAGARAAL